MVRWLTFPSELGTVPDEIELMAVVREESAGVLAEQYLFRFTDGSGTAYAGTSPNYLTSEAPSWDSYGSAFSRFDEWDQMSQDEHVAAIQENLRAWCAEFAKENRAG